MKTFRAFVKKEFLHIMRDRRTLLVLFGMPVAQIILFGYAINTEVQEAQVAVLDQSHDVRSQSLTNSFFASSYFVNAGPLQRAEDIEHVFKEGKTKLVIGIGPDFTKDLEEGHARIALIADASDPNVANILVSYASQMITKWVARDPTKRMPELVSVEHRLHYNPEMKSAFLFVPGVLTIVLMLVSAMLTSISIAREKEYGSMEVMLVSPLRPILIIVGKAVPYLILSLVNATFVFIVARALFHVPMNGSYLLLVLEGLLFIMTALSLGLLFSAMAKTQQTALMLSLFVLMMPTILLSGFIFPTSSMPWPLQVISNVMPAKHFIIILRGIMLKGVGLNVLWPQTLILTGMMLALLAISVKKFKVRLQ
ncbi:MAG TPA: ABC transporter permease [Flavobacteriales bacterium]|jgi:ABC-2 type transport system permease protein|nr:ABC transporter permease [Flavobacteriales bacterium]